MKKVHITFTTDLNLTNFQWKTPLGSNQGSLSCIQEQSSRLLRYTLDAMIAVLLEKPSETCTIIVQLLGTPTHCAGLYIAYTLVCVYIFAYRLHKVPNTGQCVSTQQTESPMFVYVLLPTSSQSSGVRESSS